MEGKEDQAKWSGGNMHDMPKLKEWWRQDSSSNYESVSYGDVIDSSW